MTPTHAAFLRAINLGRNRRVSGADLRSRFEELGFTEVDSFRTSGNVVFRAGREAKAPLTARIEKALKEALGYEVGVFLRTAKEIQALAKHQPFPNDLIEASKGKLQVSLIAKPHSAATQRRVLALATGTDDRLAFSASELFWLPSGGTQQSTLDLEAIEEQLGPTTMRTKGTVDQLAQKHFGLTK